MTRLVSVPAVFCAIGIALGCAGTSNPSTPLDLRAGNPLCSAADRTTSAHRDLWGWWQVSIDTTNGTVDVVPLRTAQFRANVNQWMQPPMGSAANLGIKIVDASTFQTDGRIAVDVTLHHPFPGLVEYTGFDVNGIFMHDGPVGGKDDSTIAYAYTNEGAAALENADGYTRWWNYSEFDGPMPIFGFTPGKLGNLPAPTATLNPYKYFADGLGAEDDLYGYLEGPDGPADRGEFLSGTANTRRYHLRFPIESGAPVLKFQYAVSAGWEPGDKALSGDPDTWDIPGDFPIAANQAEAIAVKTSTAASDLYYVSPAENGGTVVMDIEVFDRQGPSSPDGVPGQVSRIAIESPDNLIPGPNNVAGFSGVALDAALIPSSGTALSSVWHVEIPGCHPSGSATFPLLVTVSSAAPTNYDQGFGQGFPFDAKLSAFRLAWVTVGGCQPPTASAEATSSTTILTGQSVDFDASACTGTPVLIYEWDWNGDGTWDESGGPLKSHIFDQGGDFNVNMRVSNSCGEDTLDAPIPVHVDIPPGTWPMFQYDEKCSGVAPIDLVLPLTLKYDVAPEVWGNVDYAPVVGDNKLFYVDSGNKLCIALNEADGSFLWQYTIDQEGLSWGYWSGPAYHEGKVFSGGNNVYCLDANTGAHVWDGPYISSVLTAFVFGSILVFDGIVYGPGRDGIEYALNETDGHNIWGFNIGPGFGCYHPPAIAGEIGIFGAGFDARVHGRNKDTGDFVWAWSNPYGGSDVSMRVPPTVHGDRVYFGAYTQHIFCLNNQTGAQIWAYPTPGDYPFNAGCFYDGAYFQPTWGSNRALYAINDDGTLRWSYSSPSANFFCDVVASGGHVFCIDGSTLRAFDPQTGSVDWSYPLSGSVDGGIAIANNCMYIGTNSGHIICLQGS